MDDWRRESSADVEAKRACVRDDLAAASFDLADNYQPAINLIKISFHTAPTYMLL